MLPIVAIVGRPNVGKSTLFNRLTRTRSALVSDIAGLTRDRQYGIVQCQAQHEFIIVDTGGFTSMSEKENKGNAVASSVSSLTISSLMARQAWLAVKEAQMVLFVVDAKVGLNAADQELAQQLRKANKHIVLVINKIDGVNPKLISADFCVLGLGNEVLISAEHGDGVKKLLDTIAAIIFPEEKGVELSEAIESTSQECAKPKHIKIAVIGRPNVGKSTLINRILGEERVIVSDLAGTTRDSIFIDFCRRKKNYTLIDTAGIRRRSRVSDKIEKFSIIKALQAMQETNVVVLVLDAHENITEQDLHLLDFAIDNGKAIIIAVNKWDGIANLQRNKIRRELSRRLGFIDFAPIHFISALHGTGVGNLFPDIDKAYAAAMKQLKTPEVTKILLQAVEDFPPPMIRGRRIKLRYAHVGGHNPPIIVIHGNQTESVPASYRKYLERAFRRKLKLVGTPIRLELKTGHNPYQKLGG